MSLYCPSVHLEPLNGSNLLANSFAVSQAYFVGLSKYLSQSFLYASNIGLDSIFFQFDIIFAGVMLFNISSACFESLSSYFIYLFSEAICSSFSKYSSICSVHSLSVIFNFSSNI